MLDIATMTVGETAFAIDLAAAEGWNPGVSDAAAFQHADPGGVFVARADGIPVGCISAVSYPDGFGFIGLFIVVPARRGEGIGTALWRKAMGYLEGRVIGLDGVVEQQEAYGRAGFVTRHRNVRYVLAEPVGGRAGALVPATSVPRTVLESYDRQCFPASRSRFLDAWLSMDGARALVSWESGRVTGYGVRRTCRNGSKIGPLFADDADTALRLFTGLCDGAHGAVFLDVPQSNAQAVALAERHGMKAVFETARMYRGEPLPVRGEKVFGITTFELG